MSKLTLFIMLMAMTLYTIKSERCYDSSCESENSDCCQTAPCQNNCCNSCSACRTTTCRRKCERRCTTPLPPPIEPRINTPTPTLPSKGKDEFIQENNISNPLNITNSISLHNIINVPVNITTNNVNTVDANLDMDSFEEKPGVSPTNTVTRQSAIYYILLIPRSGYPQKPIIPCGPQMQPMPVGSRMQPMPGGCQTQPMPCCSLQRCQYPICPSPCQVSC